MGKKGLKNRFLSLLMVTAMVIGLCPDNLSLIKAEASTVAGYNAITSGDFLKADGQDLKNANGQVVNLRGTNAGGYFVQEFWMTPTSNSSNVNAQADIISALTNRFGEDKMYELIDIYEANYWTEVDFKNIADMGMNCIRLPFWWRNLVDANGNWYGYDASANDPYAKAFERMDWFIERAGDYGLYVVVDFHGAPGSQNGSDHSGVDGGDNKQGASEFFWGSNASKNQQLYYDMFRIIAARYAGNPTVAGYDLLNEPYCTYRYNTSYSADQLHSLLWGIYDNAYKTIRAVDPDHVIIMEATWDAVDLPNPGQYGWTNVMYEYHNYLYDDYNNTNGGQITNMQNKVNGIKSANYNVPSYMGEFCYFDSTDAWDQGLELLNKAGINWTSWTYKTINQYGNWGYYHHPASMDSGINLETASFDAIKSQWSNVGTDKGNANTSLINVVSKWAKAETITFAGNTIAKTTSGRSGFAHFESESASKKNGGSIQSDSSFTSGESYSNHQAIGGYGDNRPNASFDGNWANTEYVAYTITAPANGTYQVVTCYNGDDDKEVYVGVDGQTPFKLALPTQTSDKKWDKMHEVYFTLDLTQGEHTIYMSSPIWTEATSSSWLNYDYFEISKYPVITQENGSKRYEGEYFFSTSDKFESASHYSAGGAIGSLNMSIAASSFAADWGNVKYVEYTVYAEEAGDYTITYGFDGNNATGMKAVYKLNDGANTEFYLDGLGWANPSTASFDVALNKGFNTIKISGTIENIQNWANSDYIDVSKKTVINPDPEPEPEPDEDVVHVGTNKTVRLEGEDGKINIAEVTNASHFSNGKAVGNLNMNIQPSDFAADWSNVKYVEYIVYADEEGDYTITFGYDGSDSTGIRSVVKVNDGANSIITYNAKGWAKPQTTSFDVKLNKGINNIKISGSLDTYDNWINEDYIDITYIVPEKKPSYIFDGYYLTLAGNMKFSYKVTFCEDISVSADNKMRFSYAGKTVEVNYDSLNGKEAVYVCDLASSQLTDEIKAELFVDGEYVDLGTTTVSDYLDTIIKGADTNASYANAKCLAEAILTYGAYSQLYFDYNTDKLANSLLTEDVVKSYSNDDVVKAINSSLEVNNNGIKLNYYGSSLVCKLDTSLKLYLTYDEIDFDYVKANYTVSSDKDYELSLGGSNSAMYVKLDGIAAPDLDEVIKLTISDGVNNMTVEYSPLDYIKKAVEKSTNEKLVNLMKALYNYHLEADSYCARQIKDDFIVNPTKEEVKKDFKIVGYYAGWDGTKVNSIQYQNLTNIIFAFAIPTEDGGIRSFDYESTAKALIKKAHENNVKVSIAVGGWSYNDVPLESTFVSATQTDAKIEKFATTLVDFMNEYGFDGVDIDWEHPRTGSTSAQYEKLMVKLREKLGDSKLLTSAVVAGVDMQGNILYDSAAHTDTVLSVVDWLNVMAYDGSNTNHSTYEYAVNSANYWLNTRNMPKNKVVLGVPFYERPNWWSYAAILDQDSNAYNSDTAVINGTTVYYNGIPTIKKKTQWACENAGGIMIWDITQDTTDTLKSLLNAIATTARENF